jgi:RimJ/RimL family protein N-acetyltransferase
VLKTIFEKLGPRHTGAVFRWLDEPRVQEFWDNTQAHRDDILLFAEGRKKPSAYFEGQYAYWVASAPRPGSESMLPSGISSPAEPFALVMSIRETPQDDIGPLKLRHLSQSGHTYSLDFMIGSRHFAGRGYAVETLRAFTNWFQESVDPQADTFLMDPVQHNPRARHVYEKAGFRYVGGFLMTGDCSGTGQQHDLLVRHLAVRL